MSEPIFAYFRDDVKLSFDEWCESINKDAKIEAQLLGHDYSGAIHTDIGNGRDVEINGHNYSSRVDTLYSSATELFNDLMNDGHHDVILNALYKISEQELFNILSKIKPVCVKHNNKLLLYDEKDWV